MLADDALHLFDDADYTASILSGYSDVRYEVLTGQCPPNRISNRLAEELNRFYTNEFLRIPSSRKHKLRMLGSEARERVERDLEWVAEELRKRWQSLPTDTIEGLEDFITALDLETAKIGRKIITRRFAGAATEELHAFISGAKELLQGATWAANAAMVAKEAKLSAEDAAVAIYAAALRGEGESDSNEKRSLLSRLTRHEGEPNPLRIKNHKIPIRAPVALLKRLIDNSTSRIDRYETHLGAYYHLANKIATEVDLRPALAFVRGPAYSSSAEQALDRILDDIVYAHYSKTGQELTPAHLNAFQIGSLLPSLQAYSRQLSEERAANRQVEQHWRDIDRDLEFAQRGKQRKEKPASVPLHDGVGAVMAYAMYCSDATSRGVPVGSVLFGNNLKIFDFGETERKFITQAALYGARRFSANYMHDGSRTLRALAEHDPDRHESLIRALEEVENKVRSYVEQHDDVDHDTLHAIITGLVAPLARDLPSEIGTFLIEDAPHQIAHRVRAREEIAQIDHYIHAYGGISREVAQRHAHEFRFTSYVEHSLYEGSKPRNIIARNGQSLEELSKDVLLRMKRYRSQAPEGVDVQPIEIDLTLLDERLDKHGRRQRLTSRREGFDKPRHVDDAGHELKQFEVARPQRKPATNQYEKAKETPQTQKRTAHRVIG